MAECTLHCEPPDVEQQILQCVVCGRRPVEAKLLDCLHVACSQCLHGLVNQSEVTCPSCQTTTKLITGGIMAMSDHHVFLQLCRTAERSGVAMCSCDECEADGDSPAMAFCRTCCSKLCEFHVAAHRKTRRTKNHRLEFMDESGSTANSQPGEKELEATCRLHGEPLDVFCRSCRRVVCAQCVPHGHTTHEKGPLSRDVARQSLKRLEQIVACGHGELAHLDQVIKRAQTRKAKVRDRAESVSDEISAYFAKMREALTERENELLESLGRKQKCLEEPCEAIAVASKNLVAAHKVAYFAAETSVAMIDEVALVEAEGVLSRRLESLEIDSKRVVDSAKSLDEMEDASKLMAFIGDGDLESVARASGRLMDCVNIDNCHAIELEDSNIKLTFNLSVEALVRGEECDVTTMEGLFGQLQFSVSSSTTQSTEATSASSASPVMATPLCLSPAVPLEIYTMERELREDTGRTGYEVTSRLSPANGEGLTDEQSHVHIQLGGNVISSCELVKASVRRVAHNDLRFQCEGVPEPVSLTEDGKKVWTDNSPTNEILVVCNAEFSHGVHVWKAQALSENSGFFSMCAGVTTKRKHMPSVTDKAVTAGWKVYNARVTQNSYSRRIGRAGPGPVWLKDDILLFELNCSVGTLTLTSTRTGESDTIDGITEPVYPCFTFYFSRNGVRLLPV